jgi:HAD superfamily hydrolase (TIGR01509 family)
MPLRAALVDVGGTLWPDTWPDQPDDAGLRARRLAEALDYIEAASAPGLVTDLVERISRPPLAGLELVQGTDEAIRSWLAEARLPADDGTVVRVRRALVLPVHERFQPLRGARVLLSTIRSLGLTSVICSNTILRDGEGYRWDFELFGMDDLVDDYVTSVNVGRKKPDPAMHKAAAAAAGQPPQACVMIGNNEEADIAPALELGMLTILVHPDGPRPASSRAHAVAATLFEAADLLRVWASK